MGKTAQQKKDTNWKISQAQEKNWKDGKYKNRKVSKIDEIERFLTDKLVEKYGILIKKETLEDTESQIFELLKYLYEHRQEKKYGKI